MAIRFEWYKNPTTREDEQELFHARPVLNGNVETEEIAGQIQERCSLTEVDVNAVLDALSHITAEHLKEGRRVHLNGLGYLQISLTCDGEIEKDTKYRNTKVKMKNVRFRADQVLKNRIGKIELEHTKRGVHSQTLSDEEIAERLKKYFLKEKVLTVGDFQQLCGMGRTTANRRIRQLREAGILKNIGTPMQPIYILGGE